MRGDAGIGTGFGIGISSGIGSGIDIGTEKVEEETGNVRGAELEMWEHVRWKIQEGGKKRRANREGVWVREERGRRW